MAAKSHGELPIKLRPVDVRMGKPGTRNGVSLPPEHIGRVEAVSYTHLTLPTIYSV